MSVRLIYAPFSEVESEIYSGPNHFWLCKKHGKQELLKPYYIELEPYAVCYWSCPLCLQEHYPDEILAGLKKGACSCGATGSTVKECLLCNTPKCEKCLDEDDICATCAAALQNGEYDYATC